MLVPRLVSRIKPCNNHQKLPMQHITRRNFALSVPGLLLGSAGASALTPGAAESAPQFDALSAYMVKTLDELKIPGATLCVARRGNIVFRQGFGWSDRDARLAVTPDTVMRIASISKPITGMLILKLFEDDLPAALDYKVFGRGGLLPDARYYSPQDERVLDITLRDLLQHSGGWDSDVYEPQYDLVAIAKAMGVSAPASSADVIAFMLSKKPLQFKPGTHFSYSNFGYNILGRIIERRTGMDYEAATRKLILQPAGVWWTRIGGDTLAERFTAETMYYDDPRWPNDVPSQSGVGAGKAAYNGFHLRTMDSHGGWVMTSMDLVRFADAIDGRSGAPRLLKPSTIALMETSDTRIAHPAAGLSWMLEPGAWNHSGALIAGAHSYLVRRSDGVTWAVIYNSLPVDPDNVKPGFESLFARTCKGVEAEILKAV
jgi:CubicO group peptidase (beta-lactamase class C family)